VDVKQLEKDVKMINPKAAVVATNCRTGEGVGDVAKALRL
jgi:Ni2+-binding GTPase involved in maturation of urease and hydrogenase